MIRKLTGTIVDTGPTHVVLDVQGVGYLIHLTIAGTSFSLESTVSFWTHLAVRETALDLYGFSTRDELDLFTLLLGLPKIGPKSAAQILGQADITLLKQAVAQEDPTHLSKMSGIGKKTAEKIVIGLKDKLGDIAPDSSTDTLTTNSMQTWQNETIDALITLGYPQKDVRDAVLALPSEINDTKEALTAALRQLSNS